MRKAAPCDEIDETMTRRLVASGRKETPMTESKLTRNQTRAYGPVPYQGGTIKATVRYDDSCGNGHNTFAITAEIYNRHGVLIGGGMLHEVVAKVFPELAPLVKWHLVSSDEPMRYLANTLYWLGYNPRWCDGEPTSPPNLEYARKTAVWPDMPASLLCTADPKDSGAVELQRAYASRILTERLPALMAEFRAAVESFGFTW